MKTLAHSKDTRNNELITYQGEVPTHLLPEILYWKNKMEITWIKTTNTFIPNIWLSEQEDAYCIMKNTDAIYVCDTMYESIKQQIQISAEKFKGSMIKRECYGFIEDSISFSLVTITSSKPALMEFFDKCCPKYNVEHILTVKEIHHLKNDNTEKLQKSKISGINIINLLAKKVNDKAKSTDISDVNWGNLNQNKTTDIHLQQIAEQMYDLYNESTPVELKEGDLKKSV